MKNKLILLIIFTFISMFSSNFVNANNDFSLKTLNYTNDYPKINARYAVVLDRFSNRILFNKNGTEKCKMASTTKILTSIIIIEKYNLSEIVTVSSNSANTGGSRLGLTTNDKISVEDLLYGLMLSSGNDDTIS